MLTIRKVKLSLIVLLSGLFGLSFSAFADQNKIDYELLKKTSIENDFIPIVDDCRWTYSRDGRYQLFIRSSKDNKVNEGSEVHFKINGFMGAGERLFDLSEFKLRVNKSGDVEILPGALEKLKLNYWTSISQRRKKEWNSKLVDYGVETGLYGRALTVKKGESTIIKVSAGSFTAVPYLYHLQHADYWDKYKIWVSPKVGIVKIERWFSKLPSSTEGNGSAEKQIFELSEVKADSKCPPILYPSKIQPIKVLPKKIRNQGKGVFVYADFKSNWNHVTPVYVVNESSDPVYFSLGNIESKLRLDYEKNNEWFRAREVPEWTPEFRVVELPPNSFIRVAGKHSLQGSHEKTRYSIIVNEKRINSNIGFSIVDQKEALRAKFDILGARNLKFEDVVKLLKLNKNQLGLVKIEEVIELKVGAIAQLNSFSTRSEIIKISNYILTRYPEEIELCYRAASALAANSPKDLERYFSLSLKEKENPLRRSIFDVVASRGSKFIRNYYSEIAKAIDEHNSKNFFMLLRLIAHIKTEKSKSKLKSIAFNTLLPREKRLAASYFYEGVEKCLTVNLSQVIGQEPGKMILTVINQAGKKQIFSYTNPEDIIFVYAFKYDFDKGNNIVMRFLNPKKEIDWLRKEKVNDPKNTVAVDPGGIAHFDLNIFDYYDKEAFLNNGNYSLWGSITSSDSSCGPQVSQSSTVYEMEDSGL